MPQDRRKPTRTTLRSSRFAALAGRSRTSRPSRGSWPRRPRRLTIINASSGCLKVVDTHRRSTLTCVGGATERAMELTMGGLATVVVGTLALAVVCGIVCVDTRPTWDDAGGDSRCALARRWAGGCPGPSLVGTPLPWWQSTSRTRPSPSPPSLVRACSSPQGLRG
jgi:hypothetical protein